MLLLQNLTQVEFDQWFELSTQRQAEDRAWVSGRSVAEERRDLEAMIPHLIPDGRDTEGHTFRLARDDDGQAVAFVWFGVLPGMPEDVRFLFDITVIPEARRRGYGRGVLVTMMEHLRCEGIAEIGLNVLGNNTGAITLYKGLGFSAVEGNEGSRHVEMKTTL